MRPRNLSRMAGRLLYVLTAVAACSHQRPGWYKPTSVAPTEKAVIAVDSKGSKVIAGTFATELQLGSESARTSGGTDGFVAKIGVDGKTWLRTFGGEYLQSVTSVLVDGADNIVVAGIFEGSVRIDGETIQLPEEVPFNRGVFVAKLDSNGRTLWRRLVARAAVVSNASIAFTSAGKIAVGATVHGPIDISPAVGGAARSSRSTQVVERRSILFSELDPASGAPTPTPSSPPIPLSLMQSCEHDVCAIGGRLSPSTCTDWCVVVVARQGGSKEYNNGQPDHFCEDNKWDWQCTQEARAWCGRCR